MAVRQIIKFGDKTLLKKSSKISKIDENIHKLVLDLKDTLYSTTGIGLAAPQIGVLKRVIIIDLRDDSGTIVLLNPKIVAKVGKELDIEGCLSYPGFEGEVLRPKKITVIGMSLEGEETQYVAEGLLARAFSHEIDHLDGILYTEKAKNLCVAE